MVGTDRRAFLKKAGVAGAAAGGLWVAPSVLGSSSAFAVGSCVMRDTISWSNYSNGGLDLTSGGSVGLTPHRVLGPGTPSYNVTMTVTPIGTVTSPSAAVSYADWDNTSVTYLLQYTASDSSGSPFGYDVKFEWPTGSHAFNLNFQIGDVDEDITSTGAEFRDQVYLEPLLGTGDNATVSSTIAGAGTSASPWYGNAGPQTNVSNQAQVSVSYATTTEISSMTIHFRGVSTYLGGVQNIAITNLAWCL